VDSEFGEKVNVAGQTRGRPRYIGGRALTHLAAWRDVHRWQLLQRAEDDARERRRCTEDETMRTTTDLSRRQVRATRCAGSFFAILHAFLSSGVPERVPEGRGWPGLAGWMKAQIWAKSRNRRRDWADFRRPDEKKGAGSLAGLVAKDSLRQSRWPNRIKICRIGPARQEDLSPLPPATDASGLSASMR
jgi:hypothetical protein